MADKRPSNVPDYFDSDSFRQLGHQLIDLLADRLHRPEDSVLDFQQPDQLYRDWQKFSQQPNPDFIALMHQVMNQSIRLHHRGYAGHQISPVAPVAALSSLVVDLLNNGMGVYEMGMPGTAIERIVIEMAGRVFGFGSPCGGVLTSGGSLGNLTALLTARNVQHRQMVSQNLASAESSPQLAVMVSEQAHYCVRRATQVMGWGDAGIIPVPVNENFQMDVGKLPALLNDARQSGVQVVAVVGSACTTATGAYDDLSAIGAFCQQHKLWFHVDGAHGAAAAFSTKYNRLLTGIELADSVVLDFHKLLLTPALTTALVFKDRSHNYQTFAQKAAYLFADDQEQPWQDVALRSFECTKLMMSIKVFSIYHMYGLQAWDENVTGVYDRARSFATMIRNRKHLELLTDPQANIVCYRYVADPGDDELNNHINTKIRQQILAAGEFYIVQTIIDGKRWLRSTLGNVLTTESKLTELLNDIERRGAAA